MRRPYESAGDPHFPRSHPTTWRGLTPRGGRGIFAVPCGRKAGLVGTPKQRRVLVVDSARRIVRLARVNLERAGYEVASAFDGEEALDKAASEKPDLIVLGATAPPVDASEVLKRLRANEATKGTRVVMLGDKGPDADLFGEDS